MLAEHAGSLLDPFPDDDDVRDLSRPGSVVGDGGIAWRAVLLAVVVSVLARLRMVSTPLTGDEGGYIAVARVWSHSGTLYRDAWIDRPQGLLVIYRMWDWLTGNSTASVRMMAILFGIVMVASVASAVTSLAGRAAGVAAALIVAVTSSSPALEGHVANGELLGGAIACAGLAVGCRAMRTGRWSWLFVVSGLLGGAAISVKQSGFEGLVAVGALLVAATIARWRSIASTILALGGLAGGALAVLGLCALHGTVTVGFSRWWYSFGGYRLEGRSALEGPNWDRYHDTANIARPMVVPLLIVIAAGAICGTVVAVRRMTQLRRHPGAPSPAFVCCAAWLVSAVLAFAMGGQFYRHYWVTLTPSMAALGAVVLARLPRPRLTYLVVVALLVPAAISTMRVITTDDADIFMVSSDDVRGERNEAVVAWFDTHREPGDQLYVLCASAAVYAMAHTDPPYPYLWSDNVVKARGAQQALRDLFASDDAPRFVARYQRFATCDPSGELEQLINRRYRVAGNADTVAMLERID